ncbi:MAG: tetratricopeptide repeat protein [Deltaproteobacteria bacterium]|nr:tetratricopeptide repeat protein [Deltaproteobacteria bacterium]
MSAKAKISLRELLFEKGVQPLVDTRPENSQEISSLRHRIEELEQKSDQQIQNLFQQALVCLNKENYIDAMGFLQAVHYQQPNNIKAMNNLGLVYFELGFKEKAIAMFEQVLKIDSENERAAENLAVLNW